MKQFSEATRVQMPAMVHLTRIGYTYFGKLSEDKNGTVYDSDTNILLQVFEQQFKNLNPGHEGEFLQILKDIRKELNDDDLGRGFYNRLKAVSPVKLIDFDNIGNNTFHFTAEFTCKNGQDEFRPDITFSAIAVAWYISYSVGWLDSSMGVLLIIEDVASFFGSSVLSSLDSESERVETSSVVSDGVSFSISDSETIDSISAALSITS